MILDRRPPHLQLSTNFAETPVHVEVRTLSASRAQNIRGQWKEVTSNEEMLDIVAKYAILSAQQSSSNHVVNSTASSLALHLCKLLNKLNSI